MRKRVFFVILNGLSLGALPGYPEENNADLFTLNEIYSTGKLNVPLLRRLGLFNIEGVDFGRRSCIVNGAFGRCLCKDVIPDKNECVRDMTGLSGILGSDPEPEGLTVTAIGSVCSTFENDAHVKKHRTCSDKEAIDGMIATARANVSGICVISLLDGLSDTSGDKGLTPYYSSMNYADRRLSQFMQILRSNDILVVTSNASASGGIVPVLVYGDGIRGAMNLGTRSSYSDTGAAIAEYFGYGSAGKSFLSNIEKQNPKGKENENEI